MFKVIIDFIIAYQLFILPIVGIITAIIIFHLISLQVKWLLKDNGLSIYDIPPPLNVKTLNKDLEPFGFAYNQEQDTFFSIINAWQKGYGYCESYDEIAPLFSLIFDCEPIRFKYNDKNWLIELWKGQYGMTTGGEIGIYVADKKSTNIQGEIIYSSVNDNNYLLLSYILKKKGKTFIERSDKHWWLTGFKLGEFSSPKDLVMDIVINFDEINMLNAFIIGLKEIGYKDKDINIIENKVYLTFDKPHTVQPKSKKPIITYFMQRNNKFYCKIYDSITKDYDNTLDKLNYIRNSFPGLYVQTMKIEQIESLLKSYVTTRKM